ncbi:hypothetical protein [Methylibium petroleiphilum]|nr:hypothetical protein [Methylibium petroleiphilum]
MRRVIEAMSPDANALAYLLDGFNGARGTDTAEVALKALQGGLERQDSITSTILGLRISFAELCLRRRRLEALREALLNPHPSFLAAGRPDMSGWLKAMCSIGDVERQESLFRLAHRHLGAQARNAYELALAVDPQHPDIAAISRDDPAAGAVLAELQMRERIATTTVAGTPGAPASCQPASAVPAPLHRRRAL